MSYKFKSDEELLDIAISVIDMLRPLHLTFQEVRDVLHKAEDGLDYQFLTEKERGGGTYD